MVVTCVYCGADYSRDGRTYHKFPLTDPENLQCWLQSMKLGSAFFPSKHSVLCSDHFEKGCFEKETNIACLRSGSVPTLFGNYKSACVFCKAVKGQDKGRSFRKFPLHNAELLEKWVAPMGLENFIPSTKSLLCSDHFEEKCFRKTGRQSSISALRDNAIPTIFKSTTNGETSAENLNTSDNEKGRTKQNECNGKRVLSENVPAAKIRKIFSPSSSVHSITETNHYTALRDNAIPTISKSTTNGETSAENLNTSDNEKGRKKQNECNGKRVLSENVPAAKIRKICSPSSSEHSITETNHIAEEGLEQMGTVPSTSAAREESNTPTCSRTPETPINVRRVRNTTHDHRYETTPKTLKRELMSHKERIKTLMKEKHVYRQHISRLKHTVTSLKSIVSGLRKAKSIPESGLACLDSIADTDVSQFLERFIKNQKNIDKLKKTDGNKRKFKCQRKKRGLGISSEPYPPALRSFAMTLHFYSPKAYGFVRNKFCKALLDPSTIRSWYSSIDGELGFTLDNRKLEGLRARNKLRMAHIKYWKMKMKVALAAQTFSSSVADAIDYCRDILKLKEFQGSEATVKFIRCIDRLFDFLNSRNPIKNGYKAALRTSNEDKWRHEVLSQIEYLKGVTDLTNIPMYRTRRYVPFVGFVTAVQSVIQIFDAYVKPKDSQLKYLLTYKFSQDHLELFFCAIRSCGGWCPNPTSAQFVSAYKRHLVRHEIKAVNGNCEAMDSTKVLTVPSTRKEKVDLYDPNVYNPMANIRVVKKYGLQNNDDERAINEEFFREFDDFKDALPQDLSFFSRACVAYIGGWVVKKLTDERKPIVRCGKCHEALFQECQTSAEFEDNLLIQAKTRGGLIFPSESVVQICRRTEELLRDAMKLIGNKVPTELNFPALVCAKVLHDLLQPPTTLFLELRDHMIDDAIGDVNHLHLLAKQVCKTFMEVRMYAATNIAFQKLIGTKVRHHLTPQIIWQHQ